MNSDTFAAEISFDSIDLIRAAGFCGFKAIRELQASRCREVPRMSGVYLVLRNAALGSAFSSRSCGGRFKGKDPTVPVSRLERQWIEKAIVLYIGKAGGGRSNAVLQQRLWAYVRFGLGEPVGHWGGRLIWQLENCFDLIVCWRISGEEDAERLETYLLSKFSAHHGRLPFANLRY
jgi:hypothetical protein